MPQVIGVPATTPVERFEVVKDFGVGTWADKFVCDTACARGTFLVYSGTTGVATPGTTGTTGYYLGFVMEDVIAAALQFDPQFDYRSVVSVDMVSIWQVGEFRVTAVSGSISEGALVYPAAAGAISATQSGTQPAIGRCVLGNTGSGAPVIVRISLLAN